MPGAVGDDTGAAFRQALQRLLRRYGLEASSQRVPAPAVGGRAHVLVCGEGPAVVMVSGIGTPGALWIPLMAQLQGVRLVALDLPGYGLTDPTPAFVRDLRGSAVRFLTEVLEGLGLAQVAVCGNSLGSLFATWLALDRPERVSKLAHLGCPALALGTKAPLWLQLLVPPGLGEILARLQPPSAAQVQRMAKLLRERPLDPALVEVLVQMQRLPSFRPALLGMLRALARLRAARPADTLDAAQLARVRQATLLLWGERDPFAPVAVGERMAEVMPKATLEVVAGGHAPWLSQPEAIAARLGPFLAQG